MKAIIEAKERLEKFLYSSPMKLYKGLFDDMSLAIAALEKQIPKKLKEKETTEKTHYLCPVCGYIPITIYADGYRLGNQSKYCEKCGQKLDWSE